MAIWQFDFYLFPRNAVEQAHGSSPIVLGAFRRSRAEHDIDYPDSPNYWAGRPCYSYENAAGALLVARRSWTPEALMFGDENGDSVELWIDGFHVRLDMRRFNAVLARSIVSIAAADDLKLSMAETGHLMPPSYSMLLRQIVQSRAYKFVRDPMRTLQAIAREER